MKSSLVFFKFALKRRSTIIFFFFFFLIRSLDNVKRQQEPAEAYPVVLTDDDQGGRSLCFGLSRLWKGVQSCILNLETIKKNFFLIVCYRHQWLAKLSFGLWSAWGLFRWWEWQLCRLRRQDLVLRIKHRVRSRSRSNRFPMSFPLYQFLQDLKKKVSVILFYFS